MLSLWETFLTQMNNKAHLTHYDVIIIGGGPVGVALAIELGLQNIRTLIIEKHTNPHRSTRAQSLSARTMEFFLRWGIDKQLENKVLLPPDFPAVGIWCSKLNGETYLAAPWGDNQLDPHSSPKQGVRIPLWLTEEVLRARLQDFPSITFLKNHEVTDISFSPEQIIVTTSNRANKQQLSYNARFIAGCDGANGISKTKLNNSFENLSGKTKILSISFTAPDLYSLKTIEDGIFYWILSEQQTVFMGPVDLNKSLWFAQIICDESFTMLDPENLSKLMEKLIGFPFEKQILNYYFWDMQVQLANVFSLENRIFWLGDAAHAFAPTGGLGLNTGFGDAVNLGWKLAAVIKQKAPVSLLTTYEQERRPICINNLNFAKQCTNDVLAIKKQYPPEKNFQKFAKENALLGKRFLNSSGLTMGYTYASLENTAINVEKYIPTTQPGYFLPHTPYQNHTSIYEALSPVKSNLLTTCTNIRSVSNKIIDEKHILSITNKMYPYEHILIRPDWHIEKIANNLDELFK